MAQASIKSEVSAHHNHNKIGICDCPYRCMIATNYGFRSLRITNIIQNSVDNGNSPQSWNAELKQRGPASAALVANSSRTRRARPPISPLLQHPAFSQPSSLHRSHLQLHQLLLDRTPPLPAPHSNSHNTPRWPPTVAPTTSAASLTDFSPSMSSFYHYGAQPSAHHSGRGRRAPRLSQNSHKQFRSVRREEEVAVVSNFRQRFEAGRSFDLDDDMEFCPNLLSDSDLVSIHSSSSSDRSSLSSGSPEASPQSHQVSPDSGFTLNSNSNPYIPSYQSQPMTLKLHQPAATRIRNAIPIVNPSTGIRMNSPSPPSVSPARMSSNLGRHW
jgi:hypothetical protein